MTTEELLIRWARAEFNDDSIDRVDFDMGADGPYSDMTPDVDPYVAVVAYVNGRRAHRVEHPSVIDLISKIAEFER